METLNDLILTAQDLQKLGIPYSNSITDLIFKGIHFKKHLSFRKSLLRAGIDYCKTALARKELCFLVLEENDFTIWRSVQSPESTKLNPAIQVQPSEPFNAPTPTLSPTASQPIEPEFLDHCRQTMSHYIGSIANQYLREILDQFPNLSHRQLVDKLADCISDPQQAEEFWQRMLTGFTKLGQQQAAPASPSFPPDAPSPQIQNASENPLFKRSYRGIPY